MNPGHLIQVGQRVRQLFAEARLDSESWLRVGRQVINAGTVIGYEEDNWKDLKNKCLSESFVEQSRVIAARHWRSVK